MTDRNNWKHLPWLCGLVAAPVLLGARIPAGQAVVGALLGMGLVTCAICRSRPGEEPPASRFWMWGLAALLLAAPLIPLPEAVLSHLSPGRVDLAREFPIGASPEAGAYGFSCSPSRTVNRIWELCLMLAGFLLARRAAGEERFGGMLFKFLVLALGALCVADLHFRLTGQKLLLGFWPDVAGHGASTFVNRNHFADWVCMAVLFVAGGLIRHFAPLHTARGGRVGARGRLGKFWIFAGTVCAAAGVYGLVACGSRGGVIALAVGSSILLFLVGKRSRRRKRWIGLGALVLVGMAIGFGAAGYLIGRLGEASFGFKVRIWADSLRMLGRFIWVGSGWGTFATVFSIRKSFGGGLDFLHAENEYIQLLFEAGLLGAVPVLFLGGRLLYRSFHRAWSDRLVEPEFFFASLAGVCAFLVHSLTEFVWQVPATGLLASVLLGWLSSAPAPGLVAPAGIHPPARVWWPGLVAGFLVMTTAAIQGFASWRWNTGRREQNVDAAIRDLESSLRCWPWLGDRQLLLFHRKAWLANTQGRLKAGEGSEVGRLDQWIDHALELDPYNWQLRLERARFDFSYSSDQDRARRETFDIARINPLFARIPLEFAASYQRRDPDLAYALLSRAVIEDPEDLEKAYQISWKAYPDVERLWSLTPSNAVGWKALGEFALGQDLFSVAVSAFSKLEGKIPATKLAALYINSGRPDLAVKLIGERPARPQDSLLLCQAYWLLGEWKLSIAAAEVIWRSSLWSKRILQASGPADLDRSPEQLYSANPTNLVEARRLAETILLEAHSAQKSEALGRLHDHFPEDLRMNWMAFEGARRAGQDQRAAMLAEALAREIVSKEAALPEEPLIYDEAVLKRMILEP